MVKKKKNEIGFAEVVEVLSYKSKAAMKPAEFRHIRINVLGITQGQMDTEIGRKIERISAWENGRASIPVLVARYMRLRAHKR